VLHFVRLDAATERVRHRGTVRDQFHFLVYLHTCNKAEMLPKQNYFVLVLFLF